jgi:hypothetical protein
MVEALQILRKDQCEQVARTMDELRPLWIERPGALFTLGVGAYLDAPHPWNVEKSGLLVDSRRDYVERAERLNPVLLAHFGWLYELIQASISDVLHADVALCPGKALPGFHIFSSHPVYGSTRGHRAHVDRPYAALDWSGFSTVDFRSALSFTLAVELPTAGSQLRVWDLDLFDAAQWPPEVVKERIDGAQSRLHEYEPGRLLLHSGHVLHRIEPWRYVEGERRVTLQGHGLRCDGGWKLYW